MVATKKVLVLGNGSTNGLFPKVVSALLEADQAFELTTIEAGTLDLVRTPGDRRKFDVIVFVGSNFAEIDPQLENLGAITGRAYVTKETSHSSSFAFLRRYISEW